MFDGNFRTSVDKRTRPVGAALVRVGITADMLTIAGILTSVLCAVAIGTGHLWLGAALLAVASLPDLLDGPVAKASGTQSIRGAFFDSVADRITDSFVFGGLAWHFASTYDSLIVLLPVAMLAASQFISYERSKAEIYGFNAKGGIMERAERLILLGFGLVFNGILVGLLWVMLALTVITAVQRFFKVWKQATDENPVLAARRRETKPFVRTLFETWNESDESRRRRWKEWAETRRQQRRSNRLR